MEQEMEVNSLTDDEENENRLLEDSDEEIADQVVTENNTESKNSINLDEDESENEDSDDENDDEDKEEDDDDNDDDDEKAEAQAEAEVKAIKDLLSQNPYDYEAHKCLIEKLHQMGELDHLREAREDMSSKYPLSPEIWLEWIRDEMKLAVTPEQKKAVIELCERAVQDYLSVEIWLEYLQFYTGLGLEKETINQIKNTFERALTAAGLHVTKGSLIWDTYREFENFLASMVESDDTKSKLDHINHIGKLYRRQLSCPLLNMESTLEEYHLWCQGEGSECTEDSNLVSSVYEKAYKQLNERLIFENKLLSIDNKIEELETYKTYLNYEKQHGDPGRVTVLFERAITDSSLEAPIWLDYVEYLQSNIKIDQITEKAYIRAIRNIPWCVQIWQNFLRFSEKSNKPLNQMQKIIENALQGGFASYDDYKNLWITYLEYLRRYYDHLRDEESKDAKKTLKLLQNAFERAWEHLATFGLEGDPNCDVLQFWARTEAIHAKDMEKARSLWADIMSQGHSAVANSWLELIALEKCYGDSKHIRKTFIKALSATKDWPESIANAWINFERDEGTLEQMELCEQKVKIRMEQIAEERQKSQYTDQNDVNKAHKKAAKRKIADDGRWKNLGPSSSKASKFEHSSLKTVTFVKPEMSAPRSKLRSERNIAPPQEPPEKSSKIAPPPGFPGSSTKIAPPPGFPGSSNKVAPPPGFPGADDKVAPPPGYPDSGSKIGPPPGFEGSNVSTERSEESSHHTVDDKITVFVSNLDYTATEDEVKEALKSAGPVTDFRMVRDYKGRSKGFCYVQLSCPEDVERALELDRTRINGRPMFVSRCDPNKSQKPVFKYKTDLEKNKLFVKGLPLTHTKEQIEDIFKPHGSLKEVRVVTYRNGHSKGIAYVEFENEADAAKALIATDDMKIEDKIISVAISQPPERKKPATVVQEDADRPVKSLGGSAVSRSAFGKPKSVLSLIPRTVKVASGDKNAVGGTSSNGASKPLNNADFRNMLLNKK